MDLPNSWLFLLLLLFVEKEICTAGQVAVDEPSQDLRRLWGVKGAVNGRLLSITRELIVYVGKGHLALKDSKV